ncbi:secretion-regulating guanine nucleotide exchange factor-like isoform X2 [Ceratina calcarata]|uniref:Secretion-regulating guanine nucleotide exchange factor-like isoform X2 n=1 Tax=Ceratina calcarata TaxID=156304 RepID=A0AAJ7RWM3_9HYME|nr:secretion-regulating guanine nucleotide exchange factor-like isoform X2 [Ceratina calcarata]
MSYCLISWGANSHGQLGQGSQSEECILPREVDLSNCSLKPQKIKKIVGGAGHTLILDDNGHVYTCGWNNRGQLGFPVKEEVLSLQRICRKFKEKVADIACGWDCSAALTKNGRLFLWGSNCFGQLGKDPKSLQWTHEPFEIATGRKIKGVSMGLRHTALVTEDYKVLLTGTGSKGQLGLHGFNSPRNDRTRQAVYTFTEVPTLTNIRNVSCGQNHTIAVGTDGTVYAFGDNKHGQLGLNTDEYLKTTIPTKLPHVRLKFPVEVHSGWSHVITLNDNEIFCWGRNTYGQLGVAELVKSSTWKMTRIESLSRVYQVSVGSEHNVALTEDRKIFCWGWNEHGNCGNGHTNDLANPEQLLLPYDYTGILVGSGSGHSFAVLKKS